MLLLLSDRGSLLRLSQIIQQQTAVAGFRLLLMALAHARRGRFAGEQ
jgi:hypothetical protein